MQTFLYTLLAPVRFTATTIREYLNKQQILKENLNLSNRDNVIAWLDKNAPESIFDDVFECFVTGELSKKNDAQIKCNEFNSKPRANRKLNKSTNFKSQVE